MTEDLTLNEKKLLLVLHRSKKSDAAAIAAELGVGSDAVVQYAKLAGARGLVTLEEHVQQRYGRTAEGEQYAREGLPERQLLGAFDQRTELRTLQAHPLARIGIGWLRRKGWVTIQDGIVEKSGDASRGDDEIALEDPVAGRKGLGDLLKRGLLHEEESVFYTVAITREGERLTEAGLDVEDEVGTLTRDLITSGRWRGRRLRRYSIATPPRRIVPGKMHPYQQIIDEMRDTLLHMGFTEIAGDVTQSAFWNFDALFQPQDHPAREMQDTFYLGERQELPEGYTRVRDMHINGAGTSSSGWGGEWSEDKARQCVLRTHTTSLSIQHLVEHPEPPVKAFCIGRVYRREAIDPTHTPEFEQLEGIVMDADVNFRHLLGYLREFYAGMGFEEVRFRPGYFPYTEPSVEPEVHIDGLGWVELGGAGIFRQEVTAPWNIRYPVLAWGLGVSRVAMLKLGLRDLRMLYKSDIDWIRATPVHRRGVKR